MSAFERLFNLAVGLSVISWAVLGLVQVHPADAFTPVRLTVSVLNLCVGILFILRAPVKTSGSPITLLLCIPGVVVAGAALKLAPAPSQWPLFSQVLFTAGGALAVSSFLFLGRSFAVLPAVREIVARGPYRLVRHPAYLGEMIMICACFTADPGWLPSLPLVVAVPSVAVRILAEERVLLGSEEYAVYARRVPRRILPFIW